MIERYALPRISSIWEEENKFRKWLEIEVLAVEARARMGKVPWEALEDIKKKAAFDVKRIAEIESVVHHDVIAFLTCVAEHVGENSRYIHYGMTSSDVLDTGLALQMREAMDVILEEARALTSTLKESALRYRDLPMIGRTHGVHAEPITFGHKLALWAFEMQRNIGRLERAREVVNYGKISGAVGTYAHLEPEVERYVCEKLGLKPAPASSQILQRDRHAEYLAALAITGASLEKFALEIRGLQRTEVLEAEEPFAKGQKGSSAMPHKRNPVICERICGLARVLRGNLLAALENVALWHERDISHSSVERIIIPDSTMLLYYMLVKFHQVMKGLQVYPERMERNLRLTGGLIFSESVLLALTEKGLSREEAYALVQRNAMEAWRTGGDFRRLLEEDPEVREYLSGDELDELFDLGRHLRHEEEVFRRLEDLET
jgi:adenylosuccinate lyase